MSVESLISDDYVSLWGDVLSKLSCKHDPEAILGFVSPIVPAGVEDGSLVLHAPNHFIFSRVDTLYLSCIADIVRSLTNNNIKNVKLRLHKQTPQDTNNIVKKSPGIRSSKLFRNFTVCKNNKFAYDALRVMCEDNSSLNSQVALLVGQAGTGKTHLLQAVFNQISQIDQTRYVMYIPVGQFIREFVQAVHKKSILGFQEQLYDSAHVLILDEISCIVGKKSSENALYQVIEHVIRNNGVVVVSSSLKMSDMSDMSGKLSSLLSGGLLLDTSDIDKNTQREFCQLKLQDWNEPALDESIMETILEYPIYNPRRLESALLNILAQRRLRASCFNADTARSILVGIINPSDQDTRSDQIIKHVCDVARTRINDIIGRCSKREVVKARRIAMYLMRILEDMSYSEIGKAFNLKHTAAFQAFRYMDETCKTDKHLRDIVILIKNRLA